MGDPQAATVPADVATDIVEAGRRLDARGWVPATAGNISRRLAPDRIAITRSGVHKGFLGPSDVIVVGMDGSACSPGVKPSAETLLHCQIYAAFPEVNAVLHGHSVAGTVLSRVLTGEALPLTGYEVQKVFPGQTTHEATVSLPLVGNDQDITRLVGVIGPLLHAATPGYLIRGHGTYVWGAEMSIALARFEGLEFLLECELQNRSLSP